MSPFNAATLIPVVYAQNIVRSLEVAGAIGDGTQQDATGALGNTDQFIRDLRQGEEPALKTIQRLDERIRNGLPAEQLPRSYRNLVADSFFKPGGTKQKVERYVDMLRQYVNALPDLVGVSLVLDDGQGDARLHVANCVWVGKVLLRYHSPLPAFDLFEAGIVLAHEMSREASLKDQKLLAPLQLAIFLLNSITGAGFEREPAMALLLSLQAAFQPLPPLGKETMSSIFLSALADASLIHPTLLTPDQKRTAKHHQTTLQVITPPLSQEEFQEVITSAIAALDQLGPAA